MPIPRSASKPRIVAWLAVSAALALLAFPGVASAAVVASAAGGVLTATSDAADPIAITCVANAVKVNGADPAPTQPCDAIATIDVNGGPGANAITLVGVTIAAFPDLTAVDVDGGDGDDTITGSEIADVLVGGADDDRIIGDNNPAGTRDNSVGGSGRDTLVWNPGDGDDTNEGGSETDTIEVNGGGGGEQFTVAPSATAGRIAFDRTGPTPPGPFNLDIGTAERLDLNANGGDDSMTSTTGVGFALDIDGGDGNDTLDGGDDPDTITGGAGNDRIIGDNNLAGTRDNSVGGDGDDTLVWNPGDGDDTNEGGAGTDTIEVNGGGGGEQFTVTPSATAGRIAFDRTGPTPPGPFNLDIGTAERLDLNANGGDDSMTSTTGVGFALDIDGGDGNDTLDGGDDPDTHHRRRRKRPHHRRQQSGRHSRQLRRRRRRRHAGLEPRRRRRHQRRRRRHRHDRGQRRQRRRAVHRQALTDRRTRALRPHRPHPTRPVQPRHRHRRTTRAQRGRRRRQDHGRERAGRSDLQHVQRRRR